MVLAILFYASHAGAEPFAKRACQPGEQKTTIADVRAKSPELVDLPEDSVVSVVRRIYYPGQTLDDVACAMGVTLPEPPPKLGMIDKWRYENCRAEAAEAPTQRGVNVGVQVCKEKFRQ